MSEGARYLVRVNNPRLPSGSFDVLRIDPDNPDFVELVFCGEDVELADRLFAQGIIEAIVDEGDVPGLARNYKRLKSF